MQNGSRLGLPSVVEAPFRETLDSPNSALGRQRHSVRLPLGFAKHSRLSTVLDTDDGYGVMHLRVAYATYS